MLGYYCSDGESVDNIRTQNEECEEVASKARYGTSPYGTSTIAVHSIPVLGDAHCHLHDFG
jgi:hypothetical protein